MFKREISKNSYKNWVWGFLFLNFIILFVFLISNPYRISPVHITIKGINDVKPQIYTQQRYVKLFDIAYIKPKTILLGSSRVLWGLDPKNPLLNKYPPVYNAGIIGPPMVEIDYYFKHTLANQPNLKRVILAIDFFEMNSKFDNQTFDPQDLYGLNLKQMIKKRREMFFDFGAMFESLWASMTRKGVKSLREDGRLYPDPLSNKRLYKDFFTLPPMDPNVLARLSSPKKLDFPKSITLVEEKPEKLPAKGMKDILYLPFKLSNKSLESLNNIIETCKQKNIELIIYFPPTVKCNEQEVFHTYGLWGDYKNFQRILARLHPFWDFTSWNQITENTNNFIDGSHHVFPIGDIILARILGHPDKNTPADFGRYVTADNVEKHLQDIDYEFRLHKAGYI